MTIQKSAHITEPQKPADSEQLIRGFIFACTEKTEAECLKGLLFATEKFYGPVVIRIRQGDLLFLHNIDENIIHGVFQAVTEGGLNIKHEAFNGRYPYQVKVEPLGKVIGLPGAKKVLSKSSVNRHTPLFGKKLIDFLNYFLDLLFGHFLAFVPEDLGPEDLLFVVVVLVPVDLVEPFFSCLFDIVVLPVLWSVCL